MIIGVDFVLGGVFIAATINNEVHLFHSILFYLLVMISPPLLLLLLLLFPHQPRLCFRCAKICFSLTQGERRSLTPFISNQRRPLPTDISAVSHSGEITKVCAPKKKKNLPTDVIEVGHHAVSGMSACADEPSWLFTAARENETDRRPPFIR